MGRNFAVELYNSASRRLFLLIFLYEWGRGLRAGGGEGWEGREERRTWRERGEMRFGKGGQRRGKKEGRGGVRRGMGSRQWRERGAMN